MRTFEELTALAKSGDQAKLLTGIERNTVDGLRGVILQYRYREIDKQEADREYQEKKRNYENAQTQQELHQITCRMRVEMAKLNQEMQVNGCELCKRVLEVMDGKINQKPAQISGGQP